MKKGQKFEKKNLVPTNHQLTNEPTKKTYNQFLSIEKKKEKKLSLFF